MERALAARLLPLQAGLSKEKLQQEGLTEAWPTMPTSLRGPAYLSGTVRHYTLDSARTNDRKQARGLPSLRRESRRVV